MQKKNKRLPSHQINLDKLRKEIECNEYDIEYARKFLIDSKTDRDMKYFTPEILLEISRRLKEKNILAGDGILRWNNFRRSRSR